MTVIVRFAPSPTGYIHIGNARTALFNWLFAVQTGGRFILRLDDTDIVRSTKHFADQILKDLRWLGIEPNGVESQSERTAIHGAAADMLKQAGLLYPCYETSEELERRRKIRLTRKLPPVYGREALKLTKADKASFEAEGRKPHWRFLLPNFRNDPFEPERTEIDWNDVIRGPQSVDLASMSDPVLIREDGSYLYTLPSVADDIDMGISHIIRGDDHVTNTAAQIALFQALGARVPEFGHHNLLTALSGEGLSKRTGSLSLKGLAEKGYEPMAVASLAVLIGTAEPVRAFDSLNELTRSFKPEMASKSAAKFDPAELDGLNRTLVQQLTFDEVSDRLVNKGISGDRASEFWDVIRGNIDKVADAEDWWRTVCHGPGEIDGWSEDDLLFVSQAFELLPDEPWDKTTWQKWTEAVKQKTGRKGKALFLPLRLALTGRTAGPELANLLPLLDREGILARRPGL